MTLDPDCCGETANLTTLLLAKSISIILAQHHAKPCTLPPSAFYSPKDMPHENDSMIALCPMHTLSSDNRRAGLKPGCGHPAQELVCTLRPQVVEAGTGHKAAVNLKTSLTRACPHLERVRMACPAGIGSTMILVSIQQHLVYEHTSGVLTWPMSTAGFREWPASTITSPRRTLASPVSTSTCRPRQQYTYILFEGLSHSAPFLGGRHLPPLPLMHPVCHVDNLRYLTRRNFNDTL